MSVMTQASDDLPLTAGFSCRASVPPVSAVSIGLAVGVGIIAGVAGLLQQAGVLPDALNRQAVWFHPVAMLLFVAVPAFLGGFGRLFLARELADSTQDNGGLASLPRMDAISLVLMLTSLAIFISGKGTENSVAAGLLVWSLGAVLQATAIITIILDSCARAGSVALRGYDKHPQVAAFSLLVWTQLFAATGLLFAAPVLAASATRALLGFSGMESIFSSFAMPVTLIVLVAAFGLAAQIFDSAVPPSARSRLIAAAVAGITADGGAVVWARGIFAHQPQSMIMLGVSCLAFVASLAFAGLWMRTLWCRTVSLHKRAGVPLLWVSAFFVLLAGGWCMEMKSGQGLHTAVLSGAVFVLFGAFYSWLETASDTRYSTGLARFQFALLFAGALLSAAGGVVAHSPIQIAGDAAMAVSLGVFLAVLVSALKQHEMGTRLQEPLFSGVEKTR